MNTLIANLRHAAHNHETLHIGGGVFTPAEVKACLVDINRLLDVEAHALDLANKVLASRGSGATAEQIHDERVHLRTVAYRLVNEINSAKDHAKKSG
jgi:hypothetical protein